MQVRMNINIKLSFWLEFNIQIILFFRDHVSVSTLEDELRTTSVRPLLPGAQSDAIYGQRKTAILRKKEELMKKVAAWETQNSKQHTTQLDAEVIHRETSNIFWALPY